MCSKCKKAVQPHRACGFCGHYGDKQVLSTARQSERALRRTQAAAEAKPASPSAKATEDKPAEDKPAEKTKSKTAKKTEDKKEA